MAEIKEALVPDIGDYSDVPVIEVLVAVGDTVKKDQSLVTLESDKATMEVPSPFAGVVKELKVKIGDSLSEGKLVALIEVAEDGASAAAPAQAKAAPAPTRQEPAQPAPAAQQASKPAAAAGDGGIVEARVPDIGDYSDVPVIEVLVAVGDTVAKDQSLVTLESDKATMEVPSSVAGVVKELKVKVGDSLSEGKVVALIEVAGSSADAPAAGAIQPSAETGGGVEPVPASA
ncbi:biotin/lipoyl-containing protein, partial [Xanthomonas translucens]